MCYPDISDDVLNVCNPSNSYQGDTKDGSDTSKGAKKEDVDQHLNGLFSLVQGLGGTAVVRTYIDQLAQVLSALVGWSRIEKCGNNGGECTKVHGSKDVNGNPHGGSGCKYLNAATRNEPCDTCGCMKWNVSDADTDEKGHHLGRRCTKCEKGDCGKAGGNCTCQCKDGTSGCTSASDCKCDNKCECTISTYRSAYRRGLKATYVEVSIEDNPPLWSDLTTAYRGDTNTLTPSQRRNQCARIFLGSVCLIWSGVTYMHWTGKWTGSSPYWNNHILDGSGLDDGTLSQWLQALGFPKEMLNNSGPKNRLDKVIWDGFMGQLFLGFTHPTGIGAKDGITAKQPYDMNYAGFVHTAHRDSFNNEATVFQNGSSQGNDQHKIGAIFKLYILSCAYFTGLQKMNTPKADNITPKTIREILYWLSALPYSQAYPDMLKHSKEILKKVAPPGNEGTKTLSFVQQGRSAPITVHEYNLFAHFQAVTQYCPLVLIGIQGGIHSTNKTTEPAIHALYANTECHFTYPTVDIQAYNQVVHYIRGLFYQLYFLRKQCAVKVTCGGKWRECRYGKDVLGKNAISWMCLGCDPMEHDRKSRVGKVKGELGKVVLQGTSGDIAEKLKELLIKIGDVVVQLGNAQERLDRGKNDLNGVKEALKKVFDGVNTGTNDFKGVLEKVLGKLETDKVGALEKVVEAMKAALEVELERLMKAVVQVNGQELVGEAKKKLTDAKTALEAAKDKVTKAKGALTAAKSAVEKQHGADVDPCKNRVTATIDGIHKALEILKDGVQHIMEATKKDTTKLQDVILNAVRPEEVITEVDKQQATKKVSLDALSAYHSAIKDLLSICTTAKCSACTKHNDKCGQPSNPSICQTCLQPTTTGVPSPLQAFLEDRLPGFSCDVVRDKDEDHPDYPPAASHLGHCGGSGQCCPLPMGFRGNFCKGSITDMTGQRLFGILYFFSNENMMQSCVYTLVRVTAELSATTPQVLGDVFGFFRGGVGEKGSGWTKAGLDTAIGETDWIRVGDTAGEKYKPTLGTALENIKGQNDSHSATGVVSYSGSTPSTKKCHCDLSSLSDCTKDGCAKFISPLTGELYTAVSATFGGTYLSWVLYLSDALEGGLKSLSEAFRNIECRGCKGQCDPNKCKKGSHGATGNALCNCTSIVSCTGVLPVLYRHGFGYGNPFNLEGYHQKDGSKDGQYDITNTKSTKKCHEFLNSLQDVIRKKEEDASKTASQNHPLTELLKQVGKLQYDIRLPWIFVLTIAWLVAVLYLAFGAIWPLDWTHMRSHWLRGGAHQWQCMW